MGYGKELILDLYGCNPNTFTRESITAWLEMLCERIDMEREDLHFWDYEGYPEEKAKAPKHLVGTSGVQFITTSCIVIHTLDLVGEAYINVFTCKDFDAEKARECTAQWFGATHSDEQVINRGGRSKCMNI